METKFVMESTFLMYFLITDIILKLPVNVDNFRQSGHFLSNFYFCEKLKTFQPGQADVSKNIQQFSKVYVEETPVPKVWKFVISAFLYVAGFFFRKIDTNEPSLTPRKSTRDPLFLKVTISGTSRRISDWIPEK